MMKSIDSKSTILSSSFWPSMVLLGVVTLFCGTYYKYEAYRFQNTIKAQDGARVDAFSRLVEHDLQYVADDLRELVQSDDLNAYLNTGQPADLERVTRHAVGYSKLKPKFDQIRILDEQGMEIMRVNQHGEVVPPSGLQNKSARDYFKQTISLAPGQLYLSSFDLNMENGEIEVPYKPVLRFATPIYDQQGRKRGVYIINYLGATLFSDLENLRPDVRHRLRLLNADGYWLKAADPQREWGFLFPDRQQATLAHTAPVIWKKVLGGTSGQSIHEGGILSWRRVSLKTAVSNDVDSALAQDRFLIIASQITEDELATLLAPLRFIFSIVALLLFASLLFAQRLFRLRKQALIALSQSEQNLAVTFDSIGDAVLTTDALGNITRMNPIAERLTGWSHDEAMGMPVGDVFKIINEETREPAVIPVDTVLETGEIQGLANHTVVIARDGTERPIADSAAPIRDKQDTILGVVIVFRDVSQEHDSKTALRLSEDRYHSLFDAIDEGFCIIEIIFDDEGKPCDYIYLEANPAHEKHTGMANVVGQSMRKMVPDLEQSWYDLFGGVAMTGKPVRYENTVAAMERSFEGYAFRIGDPSDNHVAVLFADTTERKAIQKQLVAASEAAENANLAKSEFLATMSHELRTPLNGILGMNDLLLQTELSERQRRFVEACSTSGKALLQQINDVLDLSKIEAGKLDLDLLPCHLESLVYDIVDVFSHQADQKGLLLKCHMEPSACVKVLADENRLRQVLMNLLGNAFKFTDHGTIEIRAEVKERQEGKLTILFSVTDTGIGIPESLRHRLFSPFSQVDTSTTRRFGGTGLGLSVSKQLIDLMGGNIDVQSTVGEGSTFRFEIPMYLAGQDIDDAQRNRSLAGTRVLAVDGIDKERSQIGECLRAWGCEAQQVKNVSEALEAVKRADNIAAPFSVVLADCRLAIGDEYILLAELAKHPHLPIIGLGGSNDEASVSYLRQLGVRHILHDPARPSALFNAMTSVISITNFPRQRLTEKNQQPNETPTPLTGHILVVEDNRINQMYVVELLKLSGCTCDLATNGNEAVAFATQKQYSMVLMDCHMPDKDGFTAAQEIRNWEAMQQEPRHIPIVALTANALKGDRERCLASGMDDYLSKPLSPDQLKATLRKYLPDSAQ